MADQERELSLNEAMQEIAEKMANTVWMSKDGTFETPVTVKTVRVGGLTQRPADAQRRGSWVAVRPVATAYEGKTFLGIYLGDLPFGPWQCGYYTKKSELTVIVRTNPCIFVPELGKNIWGYESWWGELSSPEDLKQITDADIENVWYVQALRALAKAAPPADEAAS